MSVHYKFKSSLDYDTITFDGLHISVADLKQSIIQQKRLGKATDFDLQITNAQTKEVYDDDAALIPKNTSLIIARIPLMNAVKRSYDFGAGEKQVAAPRVIESGNADLSKMGGTEEDKINAMMAQSTMDYDPSNYQKIRGQVGEVPSNYKCHRCHKPGHWIKNCPLGPFPKDSLPEMKRNTGIPRSFLEKNKDEETIAPVPAPIIEKPEIPEDLICSICKDLYNDAVMIPCCGSSFCDDCIRTALLESDENECPDCFEKGTPPGSLIPNRFLRNSVNAFKRDTGYIVSRVPRVVKPPVQLETPEPSAAVKEDITAMKEVQQKEEEPSAKPPPDLHEEKTPPVDDGHTDGRTRVKEAIPQQVQHNQGFEQNMVHHYNDSDYSETISNVVNPTPSHIPNMHQHGDYMGHHQHRMAQHNPMGYGGMPHHRNNPVMQNQMYGRMPMGNPGYPPVRGYPGHMHNYPRPHFGVRGYGPPPGHRPRQAPPFSDISAIYQGVQEQVGTGVIDDPLEVFNRIMKEKERKKEEHKRSPIYDRERDRDRERVTGRDFNPMRRRRRSRSYEKDRRRSPLYNRDGRDRKRRRSISRSPRSSRSKSRSRSRTPKRRTITPQRYSRSPKRRSRSISPYNRLNRRHDAKRSIAHDQQNKGTRRGRSPDTREPYKNRSPHKDKSRQKSSRHDARSPIRSSHPDNTFSSNQTFGSNYDRENTRQLYDEQYPVQQHHGFPSPLLDKAAEHNLNIDLAPPGVETVEKESWLMDLHKSKESNQYNLESQKNAPQQEKVPDRNCYTPDLNERITPTNTDENVEKREKDKSKRKDEETRKEKKSSKDKKEKKKKKEKESDVKKVKKHKHKREKSHDKEKGHAKEQGEEKIKEPGTPEPPINETELVENTNENSAGDTEVLTNAQVEEENLDDLNHDFLEIDKSDGIVDLYGDIELELNADLELAKSFDCDTTSILVLPEVSKWERDEELDVAPVKEKPQEIALVAEANTDVTIDVIKRAENAIYSKTSSKIDVKDEDTKKSKKSRVEEKSDKKSLESKVIPASNFELKISAELRKESLKSSRLQSKASPVRLSVKDRLGEKVRDNKPSQSSYRSSSIRDVKRLGDRRSKERLDGGGSDRFSRRSRSRSNRGRLPDLHKNNDDNRSSRKFETKYRSDKSVDRQRKERNTDKPKVKDDKISSHRRTHQTSESDSSSVTSNSTSTISGRKKKEKKKKRSRSIDSREGSDGKKKKNKKRSKSSKRKKKKH